MAGIRSLKRDDYTTVRFEELLALREANHRLTLLEQAIAATLTPDEKIELDQAMRSIEDDLPF